MRVEIVDPPAYTPPYDRSLCAAIARAGADVELVTSPFAHGEVPAASGYRVSERFYRRSARLRAPAPVRRVAKGAGHVAGMIGFRRAARSADVVHYQWLTAPALDAFLLPPQRPRLLTPHGWLRREGIGERAPAGLRRLLDRMDAVVALSEYGAARIRDAAGVPANRVHVIPHGAFDYLTRIADPDPLPRELGAGDRPVVLAFGLLRPYKGTELLIDALAEIADAELWVVGRPLGVDLADLRRRAAPLGDRVRFVPRFVADREIPAIFGRADVVALPYRDAEQSGVLYTALAFGKPIVASDAGGFPEVAEHGAARIVPAGDAAALGQVLAELVADPAERGRLAAGAREAAAGPYSWDRVAGRHLELYRRLLVASPAGGGTGGG
ncbi:MAG TPA: glycosyltransferase family 4 protein [Solirubrobacterales bacterium]|nr:glycosyltransferase family 4 protein [Solirubrobacterales bacterium]